MSIAEERLEAVRRWLGPDKLNVLTDIFKSGADRQPGVPAARYRADHPEWLDILDRLESDQLFLHRNRPSATDYMVRVFALPLISNVHAHELMNCMDVIFSHLKAIYREHLSKSIPLATLLTALGVGSKPGKRAIVEESLFYMADSHIWAGYSGNFPLDENSSFSISESVLRKDSFSAVLDEVFDWHIFNPRRTINELSLVQEVTNQKTSLLSPLKVDEQGKPEWYVHLSEAQRALIVEIETAANAKLSALPTIGLRTLLETIMFEHVGDKGSFKNTLAAFVEGEYVTGQHANLLRDILDAGNASAHRAYFPNEIDLLTCILSIRHLMEGLYVLKPKVDALAANTPRRSSR